MMKLRDDDRKQLRLIAENNSAKFARTLNDDVLRRLYAQGLIGKDLSVTEKGMLVVNNKYMKKE